MKFIVDAQLPLALAAFLRGRGFDVVHTSELSNGNNTTDAEINYLSISEKRVVITKDGDFYDSYSLTKEPYKLLHIRTGNISNSKLIDIFEKNIDTILHELGERDVVEIDQHYLIVLY